MSVRISVVIDCEDPSALAPFWSEALGYTEVYRHEPYVVLGGDGPVLILQRVDEPKSVKNRVHIDLHPDRPIEDEAVRLEAIGATRTGAHSLDDVDWIVMADPAGNEFCVCSS